MKIFKAKIILPSSVFDNKNTVKEYDIKAFITSFGSDYEIINGWLIKNEYEFSISVERNSSEILKRISLAGAIFDLKMMNKTYIGCVIVKSSNIDCIKVEDYLFKYKAKIKYLRIRSDNHE